LTETEAKASTVPMASTVSGTVFWTTAPTCTGTGGALRGAWDFCSEQAGRKIRAMLEIIAARKAKALPENENS
jgi:hypothetical protein